MFNTGLKQCSYSRGLSLHIHVRWAYLMPQCPNVSDDMTKTTILCVSVCQCVRVCMHACVSMCVCVRGRVGEQGSRKEVAS